MKRAAYKAEKEQVSLQLKFRCSRLGSALGRNFTMKQKNESVDLQDSSLLKVAASVESTGKVPSPAQARAIMAIRTT